MSIKLASLNVRGFRDRGLLRDLLSFDVDVAAIQEAHFVCDFDARVLSRDFVVYSAHGGQLTRGVSLLDNRSLDARLDLVQVDAGRRAVDRG